MLITEAVLALGLLSDSFTAPAPRDTIQPSGSPRHAARGPVPGRGLGGVAEPVTRPYLSSRPIQLTNPATGTTCTLLIRRADAGVDPSLQAQAQPQRSGHDIDRGILGSASPCVP